MRSADVKWREIRLQGSGSLAGRASQKLEFDADLLKKIGPSILRREIDKVPLWRGDHVSIRQLVEDFAKHLYLPRLTNTQTLLNSISEGVALSSWELDGFAYADGFDEATGRYQGLQVGSLPMLHEMDSGLIVKPEVAQAQFAAEEKANRASGATTSPDGADPGAVGGATTSSDPDGRNEETTVFKSSAPNHFHASLRVSPTKLVPETNKFSHEVLSHLAAKLGARVEITIDVQADLEEGFDPDTIRVVTENLRALKVDGGFES